MSQILTLFNLLRKKYDLRELPGGLRLSARIVLSHTFLSMCLVEFLFHI